jgi:hypothetical protein
MARKKKMENATHLGILVDKDTLEDMKHYARKIHMTMSEAVREAIDIWIRNTKGDIL